MADNSRVTTKIATNKGVIIFSTPSSGQNTPLIVYEADLSNLNNKQILQYIKRLQTTLGQYKAQEKALFMAPRGREKASVDTLKTQIEVIHTWSKGKVEF